MFFLFFNVFLFFLAHKLSLCLWACHLTEIVFYGCGCFYLISKYLTLENVCECSKIAFKNDISNIQIWHSVNFRTVESNTIREK